MRGINMRSLLVVAALALSASALQLDEQQLLYNSAPAGCSAALKCTPLEYCTAAGVMSDVVVNISPEKRLYSAPLTDCRLDGGRLGKCCRDPNYTDPWPTDLIGKWVPGIFEPKPKNGTLILEQTRTTPKPAAIGGQLEFGLGGIKVEQQQEVAQVAEVGVGQYEIPGETIVVEEGGVGQYLEGGWGEFGVGGLGAAFKQSIYRILLQPYYEGAQCGLLNGRQPFGNHAQGEADFAQYPWQAMVLEQDGDDKTLRCGGVITRPDVVLTSAACVDGIAPEKILIKGGEWKLGVDEEPLPYQISQVKNIVYHPYYQSGTYQYDVAILVLAENLRFNQNMYPICLPSAEETFEALYGGAGIGGAFGLGYATAYGQCVVTGWGKEVLQAHRRGAIMHDLNVTLIRPEECKARINKYYPEFEKYFNKESSVCAEPANPLSNICSVDIGSALACPNKDGHYVLRGIYSWDSGCEQLGNQIGAFYKFDLEWYQWAIGLIESERYSRFNVGALLAGAEGQIKAQGESLGIKQEGLQVGQVGGGIFGKGQVGGGGVFGQGQVVTVTTKPEYFTYTTKPEIYTFTTKPQLVTYTTKPKIVTYTTKPKIVTYTTAPKIVTYTTKPEIISYTTKPEIITYTTKPKIVTYTTKPEFISYTTKPQLVTYNIPPQQFSGLPVAKK
ncbi:uncharacterized protein LOC121727397 [Aricia agestis]|uniref:uncharacterized protein LOC121727397 n=1 Tax=Aricia agestis TaxID=91739 RepID=UPI001C20273D|nr:uncharacterized protein LOC121727397 [Aricia agestis]